MKLPVPENYTLPEDVEDGSVFEELVTFRLDGDSLVPTMIAGVEIPAEEDDEDEEADMEEEATAEMEAENPMQGLGARVMGMA